MQAAPRSVLITGANRGLGLEFVRQLLALPTPPKHLFATCRNPDNAKDLQEIATSNSAVKVLKFDVNDLGALPGICDAVAQEVEGEGLNMLINNAGINHRATLDELTEEGLMNVLKTNTVSPMLTTKAFLPLLKQAATKSAESGLSYSRAMVVNMSTKMASISDNQSGGRYDYRISKAFLPLLKQAAGKSKEEKLSYSRAMVVNMSTIMSSMASNGGQAYDYRMSKTALNMGTSCLALDLSPAGVLALVVHPGWVQTDMGGQSAPTTQADSISGLLTLFAAASDKHAGQLYDFRGNRIEW